MGSTVAPGSAAVRRPIPPSPAARRRTANVTTPAIAPRIDGTAAPGPEAGRVMAAAAPTDPRIASAATPTAGRRTDQMPRSAASMASTTAMPATRTNLSFPPNVWMAKSLSQAGVASIATLPTARTGDVPAPATPAASSATPIATAAVRIPMRAPTSRRTPRRCGSVAASTPLVVFVRMGTSCASCTGSRAMLRRPRWDGGRPDGPEP